MLTFFYWQYQFLFSWKGKSYTSSNSFCGIFPGILGGYQNSKIGVWNSQEGTLDRRCKWQYLCTNKRVCGSAVILSRNCCSCSLTAACFLLTCLPNYGRNWTDQLNKSWVFPLSGKLLERYFPHYQAVSGMINMNLRLSGSIGTKTCKSII